MTARRGRGAMARPRASMRHGNVRLRRTGRTPLGCTTDVRDPLPRALPSLLHTSFLLNLGPRAEKFPAEGEIMHPLKSKPDRLRTRQITFSVHIAA